jgi:hypothetical protein
MKSSCYSRAFQAASIIVAMTGAKVVAAASLDFDAAVHKIGNDGNAGRSGASDRHLVKVKVGQQAKYAEMERLAGGSV